MKANAKTDPLYIANQVRRLVHGNKRLNLTLIGKYLGLTPSGISKALSTPDRMRVHARRLSTIQQWPLAELTGLSEEEADEWLPPVDDYPQSRQRVKPPAEGEAAARFKMVSPNFGLKERFNLDPGCECVRVPYEGKGDGEYLLLGPSRFVARINDRVYVETKDGRKLVRLYNVDEANRKYVILMPEISGTSPVVVEQKNIKEVRLILGELSVR